MQSSQLIEAPARSAPGLGATPGDGRRHHERLEARPADQERATHPSGPARGTRVRAALALAAAALLLAVLPATSHATARGVQYWNPFSVSIGGQTVGIPSGQLVHEINGKGYRVNWDGANFASGANICDPSMKFTYGNGALYINGNVHWGCSRVGQWKYHLNRDMPRGDACAELWSKNWRVRVARQCHYIHG